MNGLPSVQFVDRETFFFDGLNKRLHGTQHTAGISHEIVGEFGDLALRDAQHVVQHQNLPCGVHTRTNTNRGATRQRAGDLARLGRRHHFQHQGLCAGILQLQ